MQRSVFGLVLLAAACVAAPASAQHAVDASVRMGGFTLDVATYFGVPQRDVVYVRSRHIPDDEIPVVLFIAQRARVAPAAVIAYRQSGRSWSDVSVRFGLGPEIYYLPVTVRSGQPYGRALGHYRRPRPQWRRIVLSDADVVDLVGLRFMTEHYRVSPDRVVAVRGRYRDHRDYVAVSMDLRGRRLTEGDGRRRGNDSGDGRSNDRQKGHSRRERR